jgi:hypothetical protein
MEGEFQEFNGHKEVSVNSKLSDKTDSKTITGDEFASNRNSSNYWNGLGKGHGIMVNCSKKKDKFIVEANSQLLHRTWIIPDNVYKQLQQNLINFNGDKNAAGYDRLNNLLNKRNVGYSEMKELKSFFENEAQDDPNHFSLIGGDDMRRWVDNSLGTARNAANTSKEQKKNLNLPTRKSPDMTKPKNSNITYYNY